MDSDPLLAKGGGADAGESSEPIEVLEPQDSGIDLELQAEHHSEDQSPQDSAVTGLLPAKRVRKPIDKEFIPGAGMGGGGGGGGGIRKKPRLGQSKSAPPRQSAGSKDKKYAPLLEELLPRPSFIPPSVALSTYDKAAQLELSHDQLICHGCEGGYRMVRATQGVYQGSYYFEVEVLSPGTQGHVDPAASGVGPTSSSAADKSGTGTGGVAENGATGAGAGGRRGMPEAHVRVGWSGRSGELQAPVGFDRHSFAYRDVQGSKVHDSDRQSYGESYGPGDVVGCSLTMNEDPSRTRLCFYKNGVSQGVAYSGAEVPLGVYFPAVSLYMDANVRVNFGPRFIKRPDLANVHPVSDLQPLSQEERKIHEQHIDAIKHARGEK